jgi:hypothetical protein
MAYRIVQNKKPKSPGTVRPRTKSRGQQKRTKGGCVSEDSAPYGDRAYTFIDLFAGIGGTRLAFEKAGCKCVFSSEWDRFAQTTYEANFGEKPSGDIRAIASSDIPDHDILVAGFSLRRFLKHAVYVKGAA